MTMNSTRVVTEALSASSDSTCATRLRRGRPKRRTTRRGPWRHLRCLQGATAGERLVIGTHRLAAYATTPSGPEPLLTDRAKSNYVDTHGASDMVFGISTMLGYRFALRFRDLADQRFWRAGLPAQARTRATP